jgi:alkylation response protein AidB-like acyl-CoA dehydrogenase
MELVQSEDQELIAKTAADFARERSPVSRVRALRDAADPTGFSRELWKEMAELGWVGIPFPEEVGGAGLGLADLAPVLEALGRSLAPEPFLSTVLLAGQALVRGGSESQRRAWLPPLVAGDLLATLAFQERDSRFDLCAVATRAERVGAGFRLSGEKVQVPDGHVADLLLVSARTAGSPRDAAGITLFRVPREAPGLSVVRQRRVDGRGAALLRLDSVEVSREDVVGEIDGGAALLEDVVDRATAGLCAEMLGGMSEAFDLTLAHLKSRRQFGVPIGSFQALKHRAADCFIETELCRSAVRGAVSALDAGDAEARALVSLAKARCADAYVHIANEAIQMFGGVGMTDEYDIGFYLKRARAAELTFGDGAFHRDRWATLAGY